MKQHQLETPFFLTAISRTSWLVLPQPVIPNCVGNLLAFVGVALDHSQVTYSQGDMVWLWLIVRKPGLTENNTLSVCRSVSFTGPIIPGNILSGTC